MYISKFVIIKTLKYSHNFYNYFAMLNIVFSCFYFFKIQHMARVCFNILLNIKIFNNVALGF